MRKLYPAKYILLFTFFGFIATELSAQRTARRRAPASYYSCGMTAGSVARKTVFTCEIISPGVIKYDTASFDVNNVSCWPGSAVVDDTKTGTGERLIKGNITDAAGDPIAFPTIMWKGTESGVAGDEYGVFTLFVDADSLVELTISAVGYKTMDHKESVIHFKCTSDDVMKNAAPLPTQPGCRNCFSIEKIVMERKDDLLQDVILHTPQTISCRRFSSYCNTNIKHLCEIESENFSDRIISSVSVYPNPAVSGGVIKVDWKGDEGKYHWKILDMSGKAVTTGEASLSSKNGVFNIQLPSVAAGAYVIGFTDPKGNGFSKTFIIQH